MITSIAGIITACVVVFRSVLQLYKFPFFIIKAITGTVTEREPPYGYFDLDIKNLSGKEASECDLKLTILGRGKQYEEMELLWRRVVPHGAAEERKTAVIKGTDHFKTIIFDISSDKGIGDIILKSNAKIPMKVGDKYTFRFFVNGVPASPKTATFLVNIQSWDCIITEQIHWYSCKRKP